MAQVTSHLLNCSDRLLLNQIDCLRPLGLLGPWEPQSAFCLIRTFLGLMFMRFHTSAVVRSALVTPLKSNVVIRGRVHSTYCLWGRLGLGASPHQNLLPPPPAAALSPNCKEWRDQRIIWGETESPLMDSKTCLKVATPFSALAWQNTGVGFLLSPPPCPQGSSALGSGHLPIPLLFLYGIPVECQAPEPWEDSQLVHLSQALDAVAVEIEYTEVEESCQDLLGKETKSQDGQSPGLVLRTGGQRRKSLGNNLLSSLLPPCSHSG